METDVKFKATNDQIIQVATNAINASRPVGMGMLHFKPGDFSPQKTSECIHDILREVNLDYVEGRMVKLHIRKLDDDLWSMQYEINTEYQSWGAKYPNAHELLKASGVTVATNMTT